MLVQFLTSCDPTSAYEYQIANEHEDDLDVSVYFKDNIGQPMVAAWQLKQDTIVTITSVERIGNATSRSR